MADFFATLRDVNLSGLTDDAGPYWDATAKQWKVAARAWAAYTPSFTNLTLGNGTVFSAKFKQVGKAVLFHLDVGIGTTTAYTGGGGAVGISLPVTATGDSQFTTARVYNNTSFFLGDAAIGTTNLTIDLPVSATNSALVSWAGPIVGAALAGGQRLVADGSYEAA